MKIFLDAEATKLSKDAHLISVGAVAENGQKFYAVFTDFPKEDCSDYIREFVLGDLYTPVNIHDLGTGKTTFIIGIKERISDKLMWWLEEQSCSNGCVQIEFVLDTGFFDFVHLIDLLGGIDRVQPFISPAYWDLNQIIAENKRLTIKDAIKLDRQKLFSDLGCVSFRNPENETEDAMKIYNTLHEAELMKGIYDKLIYTQGAKCGAVAHSKPTPVMTDKEEVINDLDNLAKRITNKNILGVLKWLRGFLQDYNIASGMILGQPPKPEDVVKEFVGEWKGVTCVAECEIVADTATPLKDF